MRRFLALPHPIALGLGTLCCGLIALVYWEWTTPPRRDAVVHVETAAAAAEADVVAPPTFSPPPRQTLNDFISRPVFVPTRRPPPPLVVATPAPAQPPPPLPKFTLLGTVAGSDWRGAILRTPAGKVSTVAEGEKIEDWVLSSVFPGRLVFELGQDKQELLFPAPSPNSKGPSKSALTVLPTASAIAGRLAQ